MSQVSYTVAAPVAQAEAEVEGKILPIMSSLPEGAKEKIKDAIIRLGVKDYRCNWPGCPCGNEKHFTKAGDGRRHIKEAVFGIRYGCPICGHKSAQKSHFDLHVKNKHRTTNIEMYQCRHENCQEEWKDASQRARHEKKVHGAVFSTIGEQRKQTLAKRGGRVEKPAAKAPRKKKAAKKGVPTEGELGQEESSVLNILAPATYGENWNHQNGPDLRLVEEAPQQALNQEQSGPAAVDPGHNYQHEPEQMPQAYQQLEETEELTPQQIEDWFASTFANLAPEPPAQPMAAEALTIDPRLLERAPAQQEEPLVQHPANPAEQQLQLPEQPIYPGEADAYAYGQMGSYIFGPMDPNDFGQMGSYDYGDMDPNNYRHPDGSGLIWNL